MFVRAETEREARQLAETMTNEVRPVQSGTPIPLNPWGTHKKIESESLATICEDVTDGESAVLTD
jgi:hypothetical protein